MNSLPDICEQSLTPVHHAVHVEAACLHHQFVRLHPFGNGNGQESRCLVAHA